MEVVDRTLKEFQGLTRRYALFHGIFLAVFVMELLSLLIFMQFMYKSVIFAVVVGLTFLTVFTYFVLRFYFQTKKPEQFVTLRNEFLREAFANGESQKWSSDKLLPIYELLQRLEGQESQYYS